MLLAYSWDSQVERALGEKVKAAVGELKSWAENPRRPKEVSKRGTQLATMVEVFMPEQVDEIYCWQAESDGRRVPGTEATLRQCYPKMCPAPGQSWIYISDMFLDYPEEVMSKAAELFQKHGVGEILAAIMSYGQERLNEVIKMH